MSPQEIETETEPYIGETEWLSDIQINEYMSLLKKKFPLKAGFQNTLLQQIKSTKYPWKHINGDFIQIFFVNTSHWICVSRENNSIKLYDSMNKKTSKHAVNVIARYIASKYSSIKIEVMNVQQQNNSYDCGIYALAFATTLLFGKCPTKFNYINIRNHFIKCMLNKCIIDYIILYYKIYHSKV